MNDLEDEDEPDEIDADLAEKMEYTAQLQAAILRLHGCESEYAGREDIMETFEGELVWSGYVEIFNLIGHPKAKRCYAWSHFTGEGDGKRYVAVLELPPVTSPETAVRAAIMAEIKSAREEIKKGRSS